MGWRRLRAPRRRGHVVSGAIALVLGSGMLAAALAGAGGTGARRAAGPQPQPALEPSRATPAGGISKAGHLRPAERGAVSKPQVSTRPVEHFLTRAHGRVFDVRTL